MCPQDLKKIISKLNLYMNITIKQNTKPNLTHCEMICDKGLHPKLNDFELTKFMNSHETHLFLGKPGSGKTSLAYAFFASKKLFSKTFHNIYIFQPSHSRASMKDNLFDKLPDNQKFDELTFENLETVLNTIKNEDNKYNNCIIFDDMTAYLKNPDTLKLLKEMIFNRRHLRLSIFFLVQTWYSVNKDIRKLFSNIFIFRVNKNELKTIFEETVESKEKYINEISKIVFDEPYNYLMININSQRLFKNFDELIFNDENNI